MSHSSEKPLDDKAFGPVVTLCPMSAKAVDDLLAGRCVPREPGASASAGPGSDGRAEQAQRLFALLDHCPAGDAPGDLAARTVARITALRQRERFAQQVEALSGPTLSIPIRWGELVAAAAVLFIAVSVFWPAMERTRHGARAAACANNLAAAGMGLNTYAADFAGVLPRGNVRPGAVWWNVGQKPADPNEPAPSNSQHLFILVRAGYVHPDRLACPNNPHAMRFVTLRPDQIDWPSNKAVSFSYQNQYTPVAIRVSRVADLAVLADKNPLFDCPSTGKPSYNPARLEVTAPSHSHGGRGQNVLFTQGSVRWMAKPVVERPSDHAQDNIWLADGVENYTGTETPTHQDDAFLVP